MYACARCVCFKIEYSHHELMKIIHDVVNSPFFTPLALYLTIKIGTFRLDCILIRTAMEQYKRSHALWKGLKASAILHGKILKYYTQVSVWLRMAKTELSVYFMTLGVLVCVCVCAQNGF